jgi:hypothetical protein
VSGIGDLSAEDSAVSQFSLLDCFVEGHDFGLVYVYEHAAFFAPGLA